MRKEPRLHFTDEERADPALEKPIRKADRAAAKADRAQAKIPKKQVRQKTVDPKTGKVTTKLVLEDKKKPPSKLSHAVRDAPGDAALGKLHKEIRETEQDNVGVESAHKSEETAETGVSRGCPAPPAPPPAASAGRCRRDIRPLSATPRAQGRGR